MTFTVSSSNANMDDWRIAHPQVWDHLRLVLNCMAQNTFAGRPVVVVDAHLPNPVTITQLHRAHLHLGVAVPQSIVDIVHAALPGEYHVFFIGSPMRFVMIHLD